MSMIIEHYQHLWNWLMCLGVNPNRYTRYCEECEENTLHKSAGFPGHNERWECLKHNWEPSG